MRRIITWSVRGRHPWIVIAIWIVIAGALSMGPKLQSVTTNDASKGLSDAVESKRADALQQAVLPERQGHARHRRVQLGRAAHGRRQGGDRGRRGLAHERRRAHQQRQRPVLAGRQGRAHLREPRTATPATRPSATRCRPSATTSATPWTGMEVRVTGPGGLITDVYKIFLNADVKLLVGTVILVLVLLLLIYRSPVLPVRAADRRRVRLLRRRRHPRARRQGHRARRSPARRRRSWSSCCSAPGPTTACCSSHATARTCAASATPASPWPRRWARPGRRSPPAASPSRWPCSRCCSRSTATTARSRRCSGVGVFVTLIAGLTLMPALLALLGRRAFWPRVPQARATRREHKTWGRVAEWVAAGPRRAALGVARHPRRPRARLPLLQPALQLHRGLPEEHAVQAGLRAARAALPQGRAGADDGAHQGAAGAARVRHRHDHRRAEQEPGRRRRLPHRHRRRTASCSASR